MIYAFLGFGMMAYNLYTGIRGGGWLNYLFAAVFAGVGIYYLTVNLKKK